MTQEDDYFMGLALEQARLALAQDEVPIGAVVVKDGQVIGRGYNLREKEQDATLHAEIKAIQEANRYLGSWRLEGCTLYVTLEPCPMCSGALINSRMYRVVFGSMDPKAGTAGSFMNLLSDTRFNHQVQVTPGVRSQETAALLQDFFRGLRERNKERKRIAREQAQKAWESSPEAE